MVKANSKRGLSQRQFRRTIASLWQPVLPIGLLKRTLFWVNLRKSLPPQYASRTLTSKFRGGEYGSKTTINQSAVILPQGKWQCAQVHHFQSGYVAEMHGKIS